MAREAIPLGLSESTAFTKMQQGLRHALEAAVEIGTYRQDPNWTQIAQLLEQLLDNTGKLYTNSAMRSVRGMRLT